MYLDRILFPVTALGPGNRLCLWVAGCSRRCKGCANPELWQQHPHQKISPSRLADCVDKLKKQDIEGITISGGEPFEQAQELARFLELFLGESPRDVLVFTGYRLEELQMDQKYHALLEKTDVLIDGAYIEEQNDNKTPLRGSLNQRIHFLNPAVQKKYETYMESGRQIQNFVYDYKTVSVGIHNRQER